MPAVRHKRSQNAGVVYTLVDEVMAVVDALMRTSSRTEAEFGSPATEFFDNAVAREVVSLCSKKNHPPRLLVRILRLLSIPSFLPSLMAAVDSAALKIAGANGAR